MNIKPKNKIEVVEGRSDDFSVPVTVIEKDAIGELISQLNKLSMKELKSVYKASKAYHRANLYMDKLRKFCAEI